MVSGDHRLIDVSLWFICVKDEFKERVWAFYDIAKDAIERDIGKLKGIEFKADTIIFHGEREAKTIMREKFEKDLKKIFVMVEYVYDQNARFNE